MTTTNKYGLSRDIPDPIKRQVRQECGFGCVICGLAIVSYEHLDPVFSNATTHDPQNIALLCEHCHSRITRKYWSKQKAIEARKSPYCIINKKCHDAFDINTPDAFIWLASNVFRNPSNLITINNEPILSFILPTSQSEPYKLNAKFYDDNNVLSLEISNNEWFGHTGNWDIECRDRRVIIRQRPGNISLSILCIPPKGIIVERINMVYNKVKVIGDKRTLKLVGYSEIEKREGLNLNLSDCEVITEKGFKANPNGSIEFSGRINPLKGSNQLPHNISKKYGPNKPCICGSGRKYKKCCGLKKYSS